MDWWQTRHYQAVDHDILDKYLASLAQQQLRAMDSLQQSQAALWASQMEKQQLQRKIVELEARLQTLQLEVAARNSERVVKAPIKYADFSSANATIQKTTKSTDSIPECSILRLPYLTQIK